jgi:16S rRNA (cytidine1402-2'-O)-methyltransferase
MPKPHIMKDTISRKGILYLIPSILGETSELQTAIPMNVQSITGTLKIMIVEELRTARRFLKRIDKTIDIDSLTFLEYNEHSVKTDVSQYIAPLLKGHDVGLLSEAGLPCIADPGQEIVREAHTNGIEVVPLTGPSSIILALIASGGNGQNFAFNGYLPVDKLSRGKKIRQLESLAKQYDQTQIFIETPYRNNQLLDSLIENCHDETILCVAVDITLSTQEIISKPINLWKKKKTDINKRPAVFVIYK